MEYFLGCPGNHNQIEFLKNVQRLGTTSKLGHAITGSQCEMGQ